MGEKNTNQGFSDESLRQIAKQKVNFRFSVKIHIGVFVIVNLLLFIINLMTSISVLWIIYPLFGWFIGLAEHITAYIVYARGVYPLAKRGAIFHTVAYVFVISYLLIINLLTLPQYYWVAFPAVFWGSGLIIHWIAYTVYYRSKIDEEGEGRPRRERAIEKEIEKMKNKMNK